jgi:hypothetical protein
MVATATEGGATRLDQRRRYKRRRARAKVAAGRGGPGSHFIVAKRWRWRPMAGGKEMEGLGFWKEKLTKSALNPTISK